MAYGQNPKCYNNGCSCSQVPKYLLYGKGSSTNPNGCTSQAYGDGKGVPLTDKAEGEEIVNSYMKV